MEWSEAIFSLDNGDGEQATKDKGIQKATENEASRSRVTKDESSRYFKSRVSRRSTENFKKRNEEGDEDEAEKKHGTKPRSEKQRDGGRSLKKQTKLQEAGDDSQETERQKD